MDVDGAVERMRGPLVALRDKVAAARDVAQTQLDALQEGLAARAALAQQRATLQLCVDAQHAAAKLERLVEEVKKADGLSAQAATPTPTVEALLDRAVAEATRATLLLSRGDGLPFMRGVAPRANTAREALCTRLSAALRAALDSGDVTSARRWLAAYASARDADGAAGVLGELLVRPLVSRVLADDTSAAGAAATLQPCLEALRVALQPHPQVLFMDGATGGSSQQQHGAALDVVRGMALGGRAILREVDAALADKRPDAFSPGRPDAFRGNHVAVATFCAWVVATSCGPSDGAAATAPGLTAVRAAQEALLRRFNLGAYFGIRFQDIASAMEARLTAKTPLDAPPTGFYPSVEDAQPPGLATTAAAATWVACRRPFSEQVYLPALADKCLALSLQCVTRLAAWTTAGCEARKKANAAADAAAAAAEAAAAAASSAGAPAPAPAAQTTTPAAAALPTDWAVNAAPEELVSLWCDTVALAAYLRGDAHRALVLGAMGHVESAHRAVTAALDDVAGEILGAGAPAQTMAAVVVADRCMEVLRQIKGITATYRMTNKPAPTRHSHFVPGVTQPLRAILDGPRLSATLGADGKRSFAHAVALVVTSRYEELARDLVTTVKKTESSLRRLRERRAAGAPGTAAVPAGGAADSDMSDTDKICRQLVLDTQEFGRQLAKFGVDATSLPPFKELWTVVAPEGEPLTLQ